jgi:NAD(P)-dependent dehydrogenase (short-subunit alcohol dehydrogenase family)
MPDRPRVAVVTGANLGIGWAIIKGLRQRLESADIVYSHQAALSRSGAGGAGWVHPRGGCRGRFLARV